MLDTLGRPNALTLGDIAARAQPDFAAWVRDRKNARRIPHRLEDSGYVGVRNDGAKDGRWKVADRRQVIYVKAELPVRDRMAAANTLAGARS